MIIVVRPNSTSEQIDHILARIQELGFKPHISRGEHRTIIGVIGDENKLQAEPLAAKITREIAIPTIGIGASPACDGQVLVMEDMLGLNPNPPKFVRQYAQLGPAIEAAVQAYAKDVRERRFPGEENVYPMKKAQ